MPGRLLLVQLIATMFTVRGLPERLYGLLNRMQLEGLIRDSAQPLKSDAHGHKDRLSRIIRIPGPTAI